MAGQRSRWKRHVVVDPAQSHLQAFELQLAQLVPAHALVFRVPDLVHEFSIPLRLLTGLLDVTPAARTWSPWRHSAPPGRPLAADGTYLRILQQRLRISGEHDAATLHDQAPVGQTEGDAGVLLHQHHGQALLVQAAQAGEDVAHHDGSQAHRGLVQQQQAWLGHQGPSHGQHLLLTSRQRAGLLRETLFEPREQREDPLQPFRQRAALPAARVAAELQVLLDRQRTEELTAFWYLYQTASDDRSRRPARRCVRRRRRSSRPRPAPPPRWP